MLINLNLALWIQESRSWRISCWLLAVSCQKGVDAKISIVPVCVCYSCWSSGFFVLLTKSTSSQVLIFFRVWFFFSNGQWVVCTFVKKSHLNNSLKRLFYNFFLGVLQKLKLWLFPLPFNKVWYAFELYSRAGSLVHSS